MNKFETIKSANVLPIEENGSDKKTGIQLIRISVST